MMVLGPRLGTLAGTLRTMPMCASWAHVRRRYAKVTFRKDLRLNIRLLSKDLEAIQKQASRKGAPTRH
jgi:hypothetical protein